MLIDLCGYSIFFGDMAQSHTKDSLKGQSQQDLLNMASFGALKSERVVILNQVHGAAGYTVADQESAQLVPWSIDGDYIVSTVPGVALAVETADCVPLVFVDAVRNCVAIIHAGWRGAVGGVVTQALQDMLGCGGRVEDIQAYFGPSARACCYQVSPSFLENFNNFQKIPYFSENKGVLYFDNVTFLMGELLKMGISQKNIITDYAHCTVCSETYCSFRRQRDLNLRQTTIVALK